MSAKYIFVTGGVVSGLGKGITAASLGRLLKQRGYEDREQETQHLFEDVSVQEISFSSACESHL